MLRVLVVDDKEDDFRLAARALRQAMGADVEVERADTWASGLARMAADAHDVYLVALGLGPRDGAALIREATLSGCSGPCILLAAPGDPQDDLGPMAAGAADVLVKGAFEPAQLERTLRHALERTRTRKQLQSHVAELRRSNAELAQLASVVSHDLRQPLHVIAGYLELIGTLGEESPRATSLAQKAATAVNRMQALIEDVVEGARTGSRVGPTEIVPLDRVLDESVEGLASILEQTGCTITRDPLPSVRCNPVQLAQVVRNLLDNAVKYRGADPPRVHVGAEAQGPNWLISFTDNGIGVAPTDALRIFSIFQRGARPGRDSSPGAGVGLAICRRVIEQHGGRAWVDPAPGGGSSFRFTLPRT